MNIYLFPTELEAAPFRVLRPTARVVISGVGLAATAATLAVLNREGSLMSSRVVLAGLAGAYDERVAVGEVVEVVCECCAELPERFRCNYCVAPTTTLRQVGANSTHRGAVGVTDAEIENMEGATLFAMAEVMGFEACEVRAISNRVGEPFELWRTEEAVDALARALITIDDGE